MGRALTHQHGQWPGKQVNKKPGHVSSAPACVDAQLVTQTCEISSCIETEWPGIRNQLLPEHPRSGNFVTTPFPGRGGKDGEARERGSAEEFGGAKPTWSGGAKGRGTA